MLLENQRQKIRFFVMETTADYRNVIPNVRNYPALFLQKYLSLTPEVDTGCLTLTNVTTENISTASFGLHH